ncbi:short-chain dehydrogenase [Hahella sp. CCB-MM4]|uniref:SDR family oxidoreductase n=1 Tax=Hahella sp. (strain CCB-MM4) TaxID=1926491 RepID=UPI000B9A8FB8|nr:SDR family oxidoreductase [Hahella sp. CCB-MM4]OZG75189.1 short-chain dehydrogenase [Hahella sp. CCB-MM4]
MAYVVITGANRGIGLEFARQFADRGDEVIALCRNASAELKKLGVKVIEGVDVSKDSCVAAIRGALEDQPVDILVNNAGVLHHESLETPDWDNIRQQFEVNTLGPLRVTSALLPNLHAGAKVALITSRMGSVADNTSGGYYGYRTSKAGLNAIGKSMAMDLRSKGVVVALLHPGYVATEMTGLSGDITPDISAGRLIQRIDEMSLDNTGEFRHSNGESLPW